MGSEGSALVWHEAAQAYPGYDTAAGTAAGVYDATRNCN